MGGGARWQLLEPVLPALTEGVERTAGLVFTGQYLEDGKESSEEDVQESHCYSPRFPKPGEGSEDKVSAWVLCPRSSQLPGMNEDQRLPA